MWSGILIRGRIRREMSEGLFRDRSGDAVAFVSEATGDLVTLVQGVLTASAVPLVPPVPCVPPMLPVPPVVSLSWSTVCWQ